MSFSHHHGVLRVGSHDALAYLGEKQQQIQQVPRESCLGRAHNVAAALSVFVVAQVVARYIT